MLVLQRKPNQKIAITDETGRVLAVVYLLSLNGSFARIGIEAPDEIEIYRYELMADYKGTRRNGRK